jgi:hypothetical protein
VIAVDPAPEQMTQLLEVRRLHQEKVEMKNASPGLDLTDNCAANETAHI